MYDAMSSALTDQMIFFPHEAPNVPLPLPQRAEQIVSITTQGNTGPCPLWVASEH